MKILKIEFQNINSLKGCHEIDFTKAPFTVSSLFAITGPTGSGKSSILDIISLALFNMVPRLGKMSRNEILNKGAVLTRNQKEAFAKVTYESARGKFASEWRISTNRNDNLREYEMYIYNLETGNTLDCRKSEVPGKNEELIGLNYNQFIKSVLLAQGDFAKFLQAEKGERGELLEKITGTEIYRQVGIKVFQRFKEENAEIEEQQKEIKLLENDLLEAEELQAISSDLDKKMAAAVPLQDQITLLERQLQLKKSIEEQQSQIAFQKKKSAETESKIHDFLNKHGDALKKHEEVQIFAEDLRKWKTLDTNCREFEEEIKRDSKQEAKVAEDISFSHKKINQFIQKPCEPEKVVEELRAFSAKIQRLQRQRDEKRSNYKHLKDKFNSEAREIPYELGKDLEQDRQNLLDYQATAQANIQQLERQLTQIDLSAVPLEKERLRKELHLTREAKSQQLLFHALNTNIERQEREEQSLLANLKEYPQKITLEKERVSKLDERFLRLKLQQENDLLKASLEQHRQKLVHEEPCPLCGSTEHPYAVHLPAKQEGLLDEIQKVQQEVKKWEKTLTSSETTFKHYENRLIELQQDLKENRRQLKSQKERFQQKFSAINPSEESWELLYENREQQFENLEKFEKAQKRNSAIEIVLPQLTELKKLSAEGTAIATSLAELYMGEDIDADSHKLQQHWINQCHEQNRLKNQIKELGEKFNNKTEAREQVSGILLPELAAIDCGEIKTALDRLMPEPLYLEKRKFREALFSEKNQIVASLETLEKQLQAQQLSDVAAVKEELEKQALNFKEELEQLLKENEELRRVLRNNEDRKKRITTIEENVGDARRKIRRWELLDHLIGDSKGKKFNDFAQDLSLSQLLILANQRLVLLSDRYQIDKPGAGEDDSLVAIDEHMGGQRRSIKTLSGGETFILSLSMALALSDLASKNVEINSLFIDEGFGTLDPETLDQTLDTLEKLQAESSKLIGVISHVDSLKERIATQIKLSRNGQGYSTLEIVG